MIIAHLADLHLGYRAYNRVDSSGLNQREADVASAFREAVEAVIELRPDLVVVAGDVFHSARPSNAAITEAFRGFSRLSQALPGVPVVVIAGDRDTPRATDTVAILDLLGEIPGVSVVSRWVERLHLAAIDTSVLAVPHMALATDPGAALTPSADAGTNILVVHGVVTGPEAHVLLPRIAERGGEPIAEATVTAEGWDYVALGHLPVTAGIAPHIRYAGGIERTSPRIWSEARSQKGFLSYDTARRAPTFHALTIRRVVELPRIPARGLSATGVDAAIATAVGEVPGGAEGAIVRLVITEAPRGLERQLDHARIWELRAQMLHFVLEVRHDELSAATVRPKGEPGLTLEQQVEAFLLETWSPTMELIDRDTLVALARQYLDQAAAAGEP